MPETCASRPFCRTAFRSALFISVALFLTVATVLLPTFRTVTAQDNPSPVPSGDPISCPDGSPRRWALFSGGPVPGHFGQTQGIALEQDGSFLVVDTWGYRLQRLGQNGEVLATIGSRGSGPGQFDQPNDLDVAQDGSIYVADYKNQRIQRLAPDGTPLAEWRAEPVGARTDLAPGLVATGGGHLYAHFWSFKGPSRLRHFAPSGEEMEPLSTVGLSGVRDLAAADDGTLYIVDKIDSTVHKIAPTGETLAVWGKGGSGSEPQLWQPSAVTVAPDGNVYILDQDGKRVQIVTPAGQILATREPLPQVYGIAVSPGGSLFLTPGWGTPISELAPTGEIVRSIGTSYAEPWIVRSAEHLVVDPTGNVLVLTGEAHLQVFSPTGAFIERRPLGNVIGRLTNGGGRREMKMTPDGSLYIVAEDRVVVKVTPDGQIVGRWRIGGERGTEPSVATEGAEDSAGRPEPRSITDFAVDSAGNVYITDDVSLHKLAPEGTQLARWFAEDVDRWGARSNQPLGKRVTIGPDDSVYVASRSWVYKLTPDGTMLMRLGGEPDPRGHGGPLTFASIGGLAVDQHNNVYVTHGSQHTVQMLSPNGELLAMWGMQDKIDMLSPEPQHATQLVIGTDGGVFTGDINRVLKLGCPAAG